jgi:HAD superfamily hydrolase (TIGR01549 family)
MLNVNKYDYFIFDCDGVILDSNKIKSEAFAKALKGEPENKILKFIEYHKENGGVSRYKKFKYYFEKINKSSQSQKNISKALDSFALIVSKELEECKFISGVLEFIVELTKKNKTLYVVSGSDQEELIKVFIKRGINYYFSEIYGSPDDKFANTDKVVQSIGLNKDGVFFGDSKSDYKAAKKYGLDFLFINGSSEWQDGKNIIDKQFTFKDFSSLRCL